MFFWGFREPYQKAKKKKKKNKEKPPFCLNFLKISSASAGLAPQTPLVDSKCIYFRTTMLIYIDLSHKYGK